MNDPEGFVARWSRLKREAAEAERVKAADPAADAAGREQGADDVPALAEHNEVPTVTDRATPAFDPASLPPIESITAESDIRAFLQSGVPKDLMTAALRRAWTADPAIRDYIGLAENQWDFTDPAAMPGFGPLEAGDDVRQLVAKAMGKLEEVLEPGLGNERSSMAQHHGGEHSVPVSPDVDCRTEIPVVTEQKFADEFEDLKEPQAQSTRFAASQQEKADSKPVKPRRTRGRALPQIES